VALRAFARFGACWKGLIGWCLSLIVAAEIYSGLIKKRDAANNKPTNAQRQTDGYRDRDPGIGPICQKRFHLAVGGGKAEPQSS